MANAAPINLDQLASDLSVIFNREKTRSASSVADRLETSTAALAAATTAQALVLLAAEQRAQREESARRNLAIDKPSR